MITCNVSIPLQNDQSVSGIFSAPDYVEPAKTTGVIFAHGAGNDMNNPLIRFVARGCPLRAG